LEGQGKKLIKMHDDTVGIREEAKKGSKIASLIGGRKYLRVKLLYGIVVLLAILIFIKIFKMIFFFL
jgi:hypothetical protein